MNAATQFFNRILVVEDDALLAAGIVLTKVFTQQARPASSPA